MISREPLSLATFQPAYAKEPYLNTPRSLEACRIHGVQPSELVEIPYREYRKAYPNDEEAALRRFERVDGVRRCILESVKAEWQRIVDRGYLSDDKKPPASSEAIVDCEPEAHTTLLEIQAARLRKVEQQQWFALKKMVTNQLNQAIADEKGKQIISKQEGIAHQNEQVRRERMRQREELLRQQREDAKYKEMLAAKQTRLEQQKAAEAAGHERVKRKEEIKKERQRQREREEVRLQNEAFLMRQKREEKERADGVAKAKLLEIERGNGEKERRVAAEKARREEEKARQRQELADKIEKARRDQLRADEENRQKLEHRIKDFGDRAELKSREKAESHRAHVQETEQRLQDKINQIKGKGDIIVDEKVRRTMDQLKKKHDAADKELTRAAQERIRRQSIKYIKQEAHEKNRERVMKAEAYRMKKIEEDLAIKAAKTQAIKDGSRAFEAFRETLTEAVAKSRSEIKRDVFRLHHEEQLSTDRLVEVVIENTTRKLFPRLHATFRPATAGAAAGAAPSSSPSGGRGRSAAAASPSSPSRSPGGRRSPSPSAAAHEAGGAAADPPRSPLAHAHFTLHEFIEDRLPREMMDTKERIEKRNFEMKLPMAVMLGTTKGGTSSDKKSRTLPLRVGGGGSGAQHEAAGDGYNGNYNGNSNISSSGEVMLRPHTSDGMRRRVSTPLTSDGAAYIDGAPENDYRHAPDSPAEDRMKAPNDVTDDDNLFYQPVPSLSRSENKSRGKLHKSASSSFVPPKPKADEFRREYSKDHPLAGGKGKYKEDRAGGAKHPVGWVDNDVAASNSPPLSPASPQAYPKVVQHISASAHYNKTSNQFKDVSSWQNEIDTLRRQQNQALLALLDEERIAEEDRTRMGKLVKDHDERHKLELVFSEERKRASERIISMTRQHEMNLKESAKKATTSN